MKNYTLRCRNDFNRDENLVEISDHICYILELSPFELNSTRRDNSKLAMFFIFIDI